MVFDEELLQVDDVINLDSPCNKMQIIITLSDFNDKNWILSARTFQNCFNMQVSQ